jgi:hypothetical protein
MHAIDGEHRPDEPSMLCLDPHAVIETDKQMATPSFWHSSLSVDDVVAPRENRAVAVVCGHQPYLTWLYNAMRNHGRRWYLGQRNVSDPLPIGQSECALVMIAPKVKLVWAIGDPDVPAVTALQDKIKSKMEAAKFIAGFIALFLAFALDWGSSSHDLQIVAHAVGVGLSVASLAGLIVALLAFDRLLMPSLLWGGRRPGNLEPEPGRIGRPPSPVHWVLGIQMIRIWNALVTPSLAVFLVSAATLSAVACWRYGWPCLGVVALLAGLATALILPWWLYVRVRPELGYDD